MATAVDSPQLPVNVRLGQALERVVRSMHVDHTPMPFGPEPFMPDGGPWCDTCKAKRRLRVEVPVTDPRFGKLIACPDCRAFQTQQRLTQLWGSLPPLMRRWSLDTFPREQASQAAVLNLGLAWLDDSQEPWLYLHGKQGRCKTGLAVGLLVELVKRGKTGIFKVTGDLLTMVRETYGSRDGYAVSEMDLMAGLRDADVLVLDDIGSEYNTDWAQAKLFDVIGGRHSDSVQGDTGNRKRTIITSNLGLDDLAERLGHPRTVSRIQEMATEQYVVDVSRLPYMRKGSPARGVG